MYIQKFYGFRGVTEAMEEAGMEEVTFDRIHRIAVYEQENGDRFIIQQLPNGNEVQIIICNDWSDSVSCEIVDYVEVEILPDEGEGYILVNRMEIPFDYEEAEYVPEPEEVGQCYR